MLNLYRNTIGTTSGITLIALVVTIVVLLILAGITISLVFGPNGVVKKAQEAANKTNEAVIDEQAQMNSVTSTIENMLNGIGGGSGETPEEPLPEGAVQFSPVEWENGQASTIITTSEEGYTLQYQIGGIAEENWTDTTSGYEITGLTLGQTVYGRLFNGIEGSKTADITVEDLDAPSASWNFSNTNATIGDRISATIVQTDAESGLNITECRYVLNTISDEIGTDASLYTGGAFNGNIGDITLDTQELHLTMDTAGTFYLHILTVDNAGNKKETISGAITVTQLATGININQTTLSLEVNQTSQLTATVVPDNTSNKNVIWSSKDDNIASVNSNGLVTAKTTGSTIITVTTTDGSNKSASCNITVKSAGTPIESKLKEGDYLYYEDGTGITRKCVVLYDSNSPYGVEIITMNTVEDIELGNGTRNEEDVKNNTTYFNVAMNSYNNAISILNNATSKYLNTTYADKVRCVGSNPTNPSEEAGMYTTLFDSQHDGKFKDEDTNYETDWNQMFALNIYNIGQYYWLASREVDSNESWTYFYIRDVYDGGFQLYDVTNHIHVNGNDYSASWTRGLRPVFHLKSGIKVINGSGTELDPYILGI